MCEILIDRQFFAHFVGTKSQSWWRAALKMRLRQNFSTKKNWPVCDLDPDPGFRIRIRHRIQIPLKAAWQQGCRIDFAAFMSLSGNSIFFFLLHFTCDVNNFDLFFNMLRREYWMSYSPTDDQAFLRLYNRLLANPLPSSSCLSFSVTPVFRGSSLAYWCKVGRGRRTKII